MAPEKCDLNSILFLLTPAEDTAKLQQLVALLVRFETLLEADAPLKEVLPSLTVSTKIATPITPCASCARRCITCMPVIT
ncbi:hypothetical protein ACLK2H_04045 [Escherichia coli]